MPEPFELGQDIISGRPVFQASGTNWNEFVAVPLITALRIAWPEMRFASGRTGKPRNKVKIPPFIGISTGDMLNFALRTWSCTPAKPVKWLTVSQSSFGAVSVLVTLIP
jgi:hypothetical protein